jgi:hypothetical protein
MGSSEGEFDEMAMAFFSTARHTLILEKTNLPEIERVVLTVDEQEFEVPVQEFPHNYLIEYPLSYVMFAENGGVLTVHFEKRGRW